MDWKDNFSQDNRYFETENGILFNEDALKILKNLPDNSVDTVITDPPYGLSQHSEETIREVLSKWLNGEEDYVPKKKGFMQKAWDAFVPPPALWKEIYRVMKPGGTILIFAGARTQDLMAMSLRLAGFEVKDTLMWLYGSGFPKAMDISKQIDKKLGMISKRKIIARNPNSRENCTKENTLYKSGTVGKTDYITEPATLEAKQWEGYKGHGLKPAYEPIIMAMKPNDGSYAENALKWGVAGLNIDGARIPYLNQKDYEKAKYGGVGKPPSELSWKMKSKIVFDTRTPKGRFPANILLDEESAKMLDEQSGIKKSRKTKGHDGRKNVGKSMFMDGWRNELNSYEDRGGASRFFYVAKASTKERNMGLDNFEDRTIGDSRKKPIDNPYQRGMTPRKNIHPTVKPLKLIEYLVKLTMMPNENQIYLDPFLGSGTTAMACEQLNRRWIGIEVNEKYCEIAKRRIMEIAKQRRFEL